ncbi:MAG: hypothetical protein RQ867_00660 [Mariprofundaceae bacterium]|nr:hypothetical protein [Mariprofundaceae bacterium]
MHALKYYLAILFICVEAFSAHADEAVSIKLGYASLAATGSTSATAPGVPGTTLRDSDLNLERSNNVTAEAALQLGDSRLSLSYLPLNFSGSSTLAAPINFNGRSFSGAITSELKASILDVAYAYYLVNMDDLPSRLQLGIEASVKYIQAEASISSAALSQTASANIPIPTIGARGRVALADFIGLSGRIGYVGYAGNRFMDVDGQIEFSPIPTLGIYGGYRYLDTEIDSSGLLMNMQFAGPYAGAFFRF